MIVPATAEHVAYVGERLRPEEIAELIAYCGHDDRSILQESFEASLLVMALVADGEPIAVCGIAGDIIAPTYEIWLATTEGVDRHPIMFLRESKRFIAGAAALFPRMGNYVDARHTVCLRWMKWLGFRAGEAEPFGALGLPFHRFEMGG